MEVTSIHVSYYRKLPIIGVLKLPPSRKVDQDSSAVVESQELKCGIVMPISAIDECSEAHWGDVLAILQDSIKGAGFGADLVSNSDDVGVIQKRIVQNLYDNPIVVVDVSGRNSNVMFELGMRLAFDKPTIVIKDDVTPFSFDTAPIEHLEYPRDLRFNLIEEFKIKLTKKIKATYEASKKPNYTAFLKHFGQFKVASIDEQEVSGQEYILEELKELRSLILRRERLKYPRSYHPRTTSDTEIDICASGVSEEKMENLKYELLMIDGVDSIRTEEYGTHWHFLLDGEFPTPKRCSDIRVKARSIVRQFRDDEEKG